MEIFNNAWMVDIGAGILSGLFVTIDTRYLFSKGGNSEYMQKVATGNREILYVFRPGVSEDHIPENSVLSALANSSARKYKVERADIFQSNQIAEELIPPTMTTLMATLVAMSGLLATVGIKRLISSKRKIAAVILKN